MVAVWLSDRNETTLKTSKEKTTSPATRQPNRKPIYIDKTESGDQQVVMVIRKVNDNFEN
jgi:hypothetical protein